MILQDSVIEKETSELESSEAAQEGQEGFCSSQLLWVLKCDMGETMQPEQFYFTGLDAI